MKVQWKNLDLDLFLSIYSNVYLDRRLGSFSYSFLNYLYSIFLPCCLRSKVSRKVKDSLRQSSLCCLK